MKTYCKRFCFQPPTFLYIPSNLIPLQSIRETHHGQNKTRPAKRFFTGLKNVPIVITSFDAWPQRDRYINRFKHRPLSDNVIIFWSCPWTDCYCCNLLERTAAYISNAFILGRHQNFRNSMQERVKQRTTKLFTSCPQTGPIRWNNFFLVLL
jgi:hypothetical protein